MADHDIEGNEIPTVDQERMHYVAGHLQGYAAMLRILPTKRIDWAAHADDLEEDADRLLLGNDFPAQPENQD